MILRHQCGFVLFIIAYFTTIAHTNIIETSVLSSPNPIEFNGEVNSLKEEHVAAAIETVGAFAKRVLGYTQHRGNTPNYSHRRQDSSIISGDVVKGAGDLNSRITTTLDKIRSAIPSAIESVESDIAISNRNKVILALANFLGMTFGILKATGGSTDWDQVSNGNKIQVFAQILYGYGYWGPFALEYETSTVDCGVHNFEDALTEYGYVTNYHKDNLDPIIGTYFTTELNGKIKENLYCLTSRSSGNQEANILDTYINVYTQLLSENISAQGSTY